MIICIIYNKSHTCAGLSPPKGTALPLRAASKRLALVPDTRSKIKLNHCTKLSRVLQIDIWEFFWKKDKGGEACTTRLLRSSCRRQIRWHRVPCSACRARPINKKKIEKRFFLNFFFWNLASAQEGASCLACRARPINENVKSQLDNLDHVGPLLLTSVV